MWTACWRIGGAGYTACREALRPEGSGASCTSGVGRGPTIPGAGRTGRRPEGCRACSSDSPTEPRRVVVLAQEEARMLNHNYIGTEHILLGLIHEGEGVAAKALESLNISLEAVRQQVEEIIGQGQAAPTGPHPVHAARQEGPRALAPRGAAARTQLHRHRAHPARADPRGRGRRRAGAAEARRGPEPRPPDRHPAPVRLHRRQGRAGRRLARRAGGQGSMVLDQFGRNLTQLARDGKLDPVIGREKEIERVMQVLSRRTKNNPVLIGEPGVGKTAIVEGLAQDIVRGEVPETLKGKQIYTLDLGALVAGSPLPRRLRGAPEEGPQGDQDARRHRPVHRRAAHARRRRRRRGRDRRREHPQADARARRAADDRRDDARRVPQAPREGRGARAAVPADRASRSRPSRTRSRS